MSAKNFVSYGDAETLFTEVENKLNKRLKQLEIMPTASSTLAGKIVQYVGTTNVDYVHGVTYECKEVDTDVYDWVDVSIVDLTKYKKIWIGSKDDWELLTTAEKTEYDEAHFTNDEGSEAQSDVYSTTETKTNKVWIDGKPIYRTVLTTTTTSGNQTVTWTIQDLECVTNISGSVFIIKSGDIKFFLNIPYYYHDTIERYTAYVYVQNGQVHLKMESSVSDYFPAGSKPYLIIEYTKTTD